MYLEVTLQLSMLSGQLQDSPCPCPSQVSAIQAHECRLVNKARRSLALSEVRKRMLRDEFNLPNPSLPQEGEGCS